MAVMTASGQRWVRGAVLAGAAYLVIGRVFAAPTEHVRLWRFAAWAVSGVVYAAHIWYELFRLRNPPRASAVHAAVAVALGAFGLAAAVGIRAWLVGSPIPPLWLLALVAWPAVSAVPAFVVALVAAVVLVPFAKMR